MNTQRRVFRGRGGPTDGRLPKHNARRRIQTKTGPSEPKYPGPAPRQQAMQNVPDGLVESHSEEGDNLTEEERQEGVEVHGRDAADTSPSIITSVTQAAATAVPDDDDDDDATKKRCLREISHLKRRIRNVHEGIQTSDAIASPATYQENVLHPVQNCVNEWRSIARHYGFMKGGGGHDDDDSATCNYCSLTEESRRETGLAVFQLIQLSLQSGPLRGGKPGYFKRCGSQVACTVLVYLEEVIPNDALGECLGFSSKHMDALKSWKDNAQKAAESEKPPSKSALKKMQQTQQPQKKKLIEPKKKSSSL